MNISKEKANAEPENNSTMKKGVSKGYRVLEIIRTVFIYLLSACIIIAAILFATDKSPQKSMFGYRYYTVLTPSMEPELSVGDVVIVKLSNADEIAVGDVITFNPSSETETYLTHRVTQVLADYQGTGITCFKTKGDANDAEDSFLIDSSRLIGKVTFHIPMIGYIIRFVQLRWYFVIPLVIMIFVFFELMKIYLSSDKEENENKDSKPKNTSD